MSELPKLSGCVKPIKIKGYVTTKVLREHDVHYGDATVVARYNHKEKFVEWIYPGNLMCTNDKYVASFWAVYLHKVMRRNKDNAQATQRFMREKKFYRDAAQLNSVYGKFGDTPSNYPNGII